MTEYYKHYNCDGNLDEFATFLRPAYGIAIHDLDDIPVTAKDFIKDFVKNVLGKKRYVDKMSRRFMKEGDKYIPTATTIRSKVSPIDATPWESFIKLVQRMVKKDLVLQAVAIIKTAEDIHPVVTGLFFFAALVVESVGDKNYLNKMKDVVCLNFKITTGPKSFNDLCKVVDAFVLDQLKTVEETTEVNKKEDVVPSSQNSNAEIGETVLEEPTIVHEIMKAGDKEEIVPPNPVIHHIGVPNGDQTIDSQIPESSSKEESMAFERFLKSANIAFIDKETTVTFESGAALSFTDSGALNTNEVYQWIASGVKTVKFAPTARHSKLLKAIINFGSPKSVSFGCQGDAATIANPLIIRCFDSISTLECPASELVNYDFHGGLMDLNLLKIVAKSETEIRIVLKKKNIKAKSIEILLTTVNPEYNFGNLLLGFDSIKNHRLQDVESIKFIIDRSHLIGSLCLLSLAEKCQEVFKNLKSFEFFCKFVGLTAHRSNKDLPVPKTPPKLYLDLKNQIMAIDPALKVNVGWNILEFYKPADFKAAVNAYRKILADFKENRELDMNIMMSKKEKLSENKNLYTEFYIMVNQ